MEGNAEKLPSPEPDSKPEPGSPEQKREAVLAVYQKEAERLGLDTSGESKALLGEFLNLNGVEFKTPYDKKYEEKNIRFASNTDPDAIRHRLKTVGTYTVVEGFNNKYLSFVDESGSMWLAGATTLSEKKLNEMKYRQTSADEFFGQKLPGQEFFFDHFRPADTQISARYDIVTSRTDSQAGNFMKRLREEKKPVEEKAPESNEDEREHSENQVVRHTTGTAETVNESEIEDIVPTAPPEYVRRTETVNESEIEDIVPIGPAINVRPSGTPIIEDKKPGLFGRIASWFKK